MRRSLLRLLALLALLLPAATLLAAPAEVRLLYGWRDGARHVAGLEISLEPGWHTYWRVPGAAGIPPRFDWSGSTNLRDARIEWPHPQVFEVFGFRTIGYHDRVVLPMLLTPVTPGAPIDLRLTVSYGVCKEVCIPAEARLSGRLVPEAAPPEGRRDIEEALAQRAHRAGEGGVLDATCRLASNGRGHALAARVQLSRAPGRPQVAVIEAARAHDIWIGETRAETSGAVVTAEAPVEAAGQAGFALDRSGLRLTLIDPVRTVEIDGCRAPD
jgi:DsbC/DsbD-like thiol-disulfide interchange protein